MGYSVALASWHLSECLTCVTCPSKKPHMATGCRATIWGWVSSHGISVNFVGTSTASIRPLCWPSWFRRPCPTVKNHAAPRSAVAKLTSVVSNGKVLSKSHSVLDPSRDSSRARQHRRKWFLEATAAWRWSFAGAATGRFLGGTISQAACSKWRVSRNGSTPIARWFLMENPNLKWMIWGRPFQETFKWFKQQAIESTATTAARSFAMTIDHLLREQCEYFVPAFSILLNIYTVCTVSTPLNNPLRSSK